MKTFSKLGKLIEYFDDLAIFVFERKITIRKLKLGGEVQFTNKKKACRISAY